jgi:hypothetical protein
MKPDDVSIINISVSPLDGTIFGLGNDSNVYTWNSIDGGWKLHVES